MTHLIMLKMKNGNQHIVPVIKCHVVIESICHCLWTRSYTIWNSRRLMIHISACSRISSNAMLDMLISEQQRDFANSEPKEIRSNSESFWQKHLKRLSKFNSGDSHHRRISYFSVGNIFYVVSRGNPTHVFNIYCKSWLLMFLTFVVECGRVFRTISVEN